jgi:hypothetical protein
LFSHLETIDKTVKVDSVLKGHAMKPLAGTFLASAEVGEEINAPASSSTRKKQAVPFKESAGWVPVPV